MLTAEFYAVYVDYCVLRLENSAYEFVARSYFNNLFYSVNKFNVTRVNDFSAYAADYCVELACRNVSVKAFFLNKIYYIFDLFFRSAVAHNYEHSVPFLVKLLMLHQ